MSRAVLIAGLSGIYVLVLASAKPLDLLIGLVLAGGVVVLLRRTLPAGGERAAGAGAIARRLVHAPRLFLYIAWTIVVGTWHVALVVLGLRPLRTAGIVELPVDDRSEAGAVVSALALTLSPGDLLVDFDWEREVALMHVLDARDPDALRRRWREDYERRQREVLP
ncbi:MAG TPA: Na+/H+ antiporter subunit E [Solirubrobacteraceae bacterium]|nr:Na+/H+ antiporter subunit E [Solirubrobacteraceae bacterium]